MPNPFMRNVQQNTSDETMTSEHPVFTDPLMESYEGTNHPYRGIETHGVPDTGNPTDVVPEYSYGTRPVPYDAPGKDSDPIPVKIVEQGGKEFKTWRTRQFPLEPNSVPRQIVSANPNRTSLRIKNTAAFTVYIGDDNTVASYTGFPLATGESLDLDIHADVWAINPDAVNAATIVVIEYLSLPIGKR